MTSASGPHSYGLTAEQDNWTVYGKTRSTIDEQPLSKDELDKISRWMHASLYICLGMLYLKDNPLLREPLKKEHFKARLLGHWGSDAGQSFIYIHMNRLIKKYDLDAFIVSGPGHGAPGLISNFYLEGVYSEVYPDKSEDVLGLQKFFKQFSFPGGIGSHMTPEVSLLESHAANSISTDNSPDSRQHPRGWRAWLLPISRLWCRI